MQLAKSTCEVADTILLVDRPATVIGALTLTSLTDVTNMTRGDFKMVRTLHSCIG